jgi:hypothetical protein
MISRGVGGVSAVLALSRSPLTSSQPTTKTPAANDPTGSVKSTLGDA